MGKTRLIAETGAGQHGVATAIVGAALGLPVEVYMGEIDVERQRLNVFRMELLGATRASRCTPGTRTLKDAINEALRDWAASFETTHYLLGHGRRSASLPDHGPRLPVRDRDRDAAPVLLAPRSAAPTSWSPASAAGRTRSGCSRPFAGRPDGPDGRGGGRRRGARHRKTRRHPLGGAPGVLHGTLSYLLQDAAGQVAETPLGRRRASITPASAPSTPTSRRPAGSSTRP